MTKLKVESELKRAAGHVRKGEVEQARAIYRALLAVFPGNKRVQQALAAIGPAHVLALGPGDPPGEQLAALTGLFRQGRLAEVVAQGELLVRQYPASFVLWNLLGASSAQSGQIDFAVTAFGRACALNPGVAEVHANLGNALRAQGKLEEAAASYTRALALKPDAAAIHCDLGNALAGLGRLDSAVASYTRALELQPGYAQAHNNLGNALFEQGQLDAAAACYTRALTLQPDYADPHNNLGNVFNRQDLPDAAARSCQRALALQPDFADAHNSLGNALARLGQSAAAVASYRQALTLKPGYAEALHNLGNALVDLGMLDEATQCYAEALALKPDYPEAETQMLHQLQHMGDWRDHDRLASACVRLAAHGQALPPWNFLSMADDAGLQLQFSRKWAAEKYPMAAPASLTRPHVRPARLRIGYFSADFYDHATLTLMAGLLREHDRAKFEICAYSYGRQPSGEWGERARHDVDRFFDVASQPSRAIADLARSHALDIAIDLKGYTGHARLDLFQDRLAPVQISYLGYPGSLATNFLDYIVADPLVIPDDSRASYSESVIWLPHSYQPNDQTREIATTTTTRADFGLPDKGFVLCCFNNSYKISPREFDIWMRLLDRIEGSVLWLLKANRWCEANLRREAVLRGIAPERLVFADRANQAHHLARHKHADLFVDTFNVNAHTTASDALWAGLPVVTKAGNQFAARVSASLLTAVGLPEFITANDEDYEALILAIASDPARLAALKAKLAANRLDHALFDTRTYTRHFEAGLEQAYDRYFNGQPVQDIRVTAG